MIRNSYATGTIDNIGMNAGLVAINANEGTIENSYAIGSVLGSNQGGLVHTNTGGAITDSYWDIETSDVSSGSHGLGKTTEELQMGMAQDSDPSQAYHNWSDENWDFGTVRQYPILKHAAGPDDNACGAASQLPQCGNLLNPGLHYADDNHGLRSLIARYSILSPSFDVAEQNAVGVYYGAIESDTPEIELIARTREAFATYSIYVGNSTTAMHADIASGNPSGVITLNTDDVTRVTVEVEGTRTIRYPLYLNYVERPAADADRDGLVDLQYLEDIRAIDFNFAGGEIGYRSSETAKLNILGCPDNVCSGYELQRSLDFNDPASYRDAEANMARWTNAGWQPIAIKDALFNGNGHTISNLKVRSRDGGGLFSIVEASTIDGLGLLNVDLSGAIASGGIARMVRGNRSNISNSYVIGSIEGREKVGGLLAENAASSVIRIANSYFIGTIVTTDDGNAIGGLISGNIGTLDIYNSHAIGSLISRINAAEIGLIAQNTGHITINDSFTAALGMRDGMADMALLSNSGENDPTIDQSYFDSDIAQVDESANNAKSTAELQMPSNASGIYSGWDEADWDFGNTAQYPAIKYNAAECRTASPPLQCGTVLPYQGSLLKSFALVGDAGINRPFNFARFNYAIAVGSDQENLQFIASAFNPQATIVVSKDSSEVGEFTSGMPISPIALNPQGNTIVDVVVKESDERTSYRYRFTVSHLDVRVNRAEIDADADGLIDVGTAEQLSAMRYSLNGNFYKESANGIEIYCLVGCTGFELIDDIDLAGVNWQHIGTDSNRFNTHFNGNGHTISNLSISGGSNLSLFGYVGTAATIENIRLRNFNIDGGTQIAALAAFNYGTINNSHSIDANLRALRSPGGLVSINYGTIYNSSSINGTLHSDSTGGGLVSNNNGSIVNSRAIGLNIIATHASSNIGGLVGANQGDISGSFATGGNMMASGNNTGGLVGLATVDSNNTSVRSLIRNSYATNSVDGAASGSLVGSSLGSNLEIINSYATGSVEGTDSALKNGGLQGGDNAGMVSNSYWNSQTSGQSSSQGGTGKTTMELQTGVANNINAATTYYQWDIEDWYFGNAGQYPAAVYIPGSGTPLCREPSEAQLASCAGRVPASLNAADDSIICRDRLRQSDEELPYCGALVSGQHLGLIHLELSDGVNLTPAFNPEIESYQLVVDSGQTEFRTTPTAYYRSDTVILRADGLEQVIADNTRSPTIILDDYASIFIVVRAADSNAMREYQFAIKEVDADSDGLIEISSLEQLNAMRYQLDGSSYQASEKMDAISNGCPSLSGCNGYELTRDLDFADPDSYEAAVVNPHWINGAGWQPIGNAEAPFTAQFAGNGHTISNLLIRRNDTDAVGFFGVSSETTISSFGIHNAELIGGKDVESVGILIGEDKSNSKIINSYAIGTLRSSDDSAFAGALAGVYRGEIINSYAYASVFASHYAGGLVGKLSDGAIRSSYAAGTVSGGTAAGGLIAEMTVSTVANSYATGAISGLKGGNLIALVSVVPGQSAAISNSYAIGVNNAGTAYGIAEYSANNNVNVTTSYWDSERSGISSDALGMGQTTEALQMPTSSTGIYSMWSDAAWDFGTATQYPTLKYASNCGGSNLPVCGSALPNQYIGLQDLAFSEEVLQISPLFNPLIHEYQLTLRAGATQFHTTPTNINGQSYAIRNTSTNRDSNEQNGRYPIIVFESGSNTITIQEILPGDARGPTYTLIVTHHPYLIDNVDVDADDDGLIEVRNIRDLNAMRYQLDGSGVRASAASNKITTGCLPATGCIGYELVADIDLDLVAAGWDPIGAGDDSDIDSGFHFGAIFDGNRDLGYEISNLTINAPDADAIGLFAYLESTAEVRNLVLANVAIDGKANIGGVAGHSKGLIINSKVLGSFSGNTNIGSLTGRNDGFIGSSIADVRISGNSLAGSDSRNIGSLAGHNSGRIINSGAVADIIGNTNVGALVGINDGSGGDEARIINSHASGRVVGENAVGGLVGRNESNAAIHNSYAGSEVLGNVAAGGLVGLNFGTLANSYASGNIAAREQGGGLVGNNRNASDAVINSYAISRVSGISDIGALIGLGSEGVNNSYWDSSISGQLQSAGGIGKTTAELQNPITSIGIYSTWSDSDWDFGTSSEYPQLKYALGNDSEMPACGETGLPDCDDAQVYGLTNLEVAGLVVSPQFEPSRLHYAVAMELGVVSSLRVIADAADSNAEITIAYKEQRIAAESGMTSEPIMLDSETSEAIRIKVEGAQNITEYMLELDYYSFDLGRLADADGNGLIEITALEDLNAIRHSLGGRIYRLQLSDSTFTQTAAGCPTTSTVPACSGYELSRDLDFTDAASYRSGTVNRDWMNSWDPIGGIFNANFNGNGNTISNLHINGVSAKDGAGLFHTIGTAGRVENLNMRNVTIEGLAGGEKVGGMASENRGVIFNSRIINADIEGVGDSLRGAAHIGGLVGLNNGSGANVGNIEHSVVYGSVRARIFIFPTLNAHRIGALVGTNQNGAEINNSHAVGTVNAACVAGGLVGEQSTANRTNSDDISTIRNSYTDIDISLASDQCATSNVKLGAGLVAVNGSSDIVNSYALLSAMSSSDIHGLSGTDGSSEVTASYWDSDLYSGTTGAGLAQNTVTLQTPTTATGIYSQWSEDDWDFGTSTQYPTLKAADGNVATQVWDAGLLEDITIKNAALESNFKALEFKYRLFVDGIQPPPQITFNVSTRSHVNIEIYCDEMRCPLADPADPTTILFAVTAPEEIRIVARQGNRVVEYRFVIVYNELTLTNVDAISVNEGDTFSVTSNYPSSASHSILWTKIAGPSIDASNTDRLELTLQPQSDLVSKAADHSIVKFKLELSINEQVYITREISARINKVNNGNNVTS